MAYIKQFLESRAWVWIRRFYIAYSIVADIALIVGVIGLTSGALVIVL